MKDWRRAAPRATRCGVMSILILLQQAAGDAGMDVLRLVLFTLRLLPVSSPLESPAWNEAVHLRYEIAQACAAATPDETERFVCAKIPRYESNYREDVARCRVRGSAGEVTAWQILARSKEERARLCVSLEEDARVAVERIRESRRACRHLPPNEQLAIYTRGRCDSAEGKRLSRVRWPYKREVEF